VEFKVSVMWSHMMSSAKCSMQCVCGPLNPGLFAMFPKYLAQLELFYDQLTLCIEFGTSL